MARILKTRMLASAAVIAAATIAGNAFAQEGGEATGGDARAPVENNARTSITDETIVVTARRREEAIEDVPIAITALSAEDLERNSLRSVEDLRVVVPGLNASGLGRGQANFYIRGQGPGNLTGLARNITGVQTYFAEVPQTIRGTGTFFDLQNVQVLKGPQGTLFGRNTTGGAVLFEPHKPEFQNGGALEVQYGNYNQVLVEGHINVAPVPDVFAIRLSGQLQRRDGFTTSIITGQDQDDRKYESFRASFLLSPGDRFENETIFTYYNNDNNGSGQVISQLSPSPQLSSVPLSAQTRAILSQILGRPVTATSIPVTTGGTTSIACASAPVQLPGCPAAVFGSSQLGAIVSTFAAGGSFYLLAPTATFNDILATQAQIGPRRNQNPILSYTREQSIGVINKTTFDLSDALTLKNIFSYTKYRKAEALDYAGTPLPLIRVLGPGLAGNRWSEGAETLTEELQLQGEIGERFNFILGGYYEDVKPGFDQSTRGIQVGSMAIRAFDYHDKSKAVFGHVEWSPIDIVTISGGVRRTWDDREASITNLVAATGVCNQINPQTGAIQCPITNNASFKAWTYDGTVSVRPTDGLLIYAAYRRGYKSGGLNIPIAPAAAPLPADFYASFGPEYVDDIEVGAKVDMNLGSVPTRLNIALFRDNYKDQQINTSVPFQNPDGSTNATTQIQNIAESRIQGFEADLSIEPVQGLVLGAFASYLDAKPKDDLFDPVTGRLIFDDDEQLLNSPKWKWGLSGALTVPMGTDNGEVTLSANYAWQSKTITSAAAVLIQPLPSYGVLNARLVWENAFGSNLDVGAFATNLLNKAYALGGYPIEQLGFQSFLYGEPRMYGISVKLRFGDDRR